MTQLTVNLRPLPLDAGKAEKRRLPVLPVARMLETQRTLTAVERFAQHHDSEEGPASARYYRDLIPLERPKSGEQFAFEVDLDACTGCKACVAACHTLNGLDADEVWRTVGLLHGGVSEAPVQQTVTTACHHCLDPACLRGCPVGAYEKDPLTGIVKHLDDQCFGCQYCTLMCPYDAPKYNAERGVVRKCDMCSDRLAHGEAPACVQACPNQAIAVRIVERAAIVEAADAQSFVPGAPPPEHTLPTTRYKTKRALPTNLLPVDFYRTRASAPHLPLVVMLALTQLSAGAFALGFLFDSALGSADARLANSVFAGAVVIVALAASVFHLGRPWLAFRAVLGLRTSWLSREAVAFGVFAKLVLLHAALLGLPRVFELPAEAELAAAAPLVHALGALAGLGGVFCSVMVYAATRRAHWSGTQTGIRFFGSTLLLGAAALLAVRAVQDPGAGADSMSRALYSLVLTSALCKLGFEAGNLLYASERSYSALKRVARVMLGELSTSTALRFLLGVIGGVLLPAAALFPLADRAWAPGGTVCMFLALLAGELFERRLFFSAAPASRMPGSLR